MAFEGAVIREQGVTFAIAVVQRSVLDNAARRDRALQEFHSVFGGIPVVLMAQDAHGVPTWYGRRDLTAFLSNVPLEAIPWQRYSV